MTNATGKKNLIKLNRSAYLKKWRAENPEYFKIYYSKHKKEFCEKSKEYRDSKKGQAVIQVYEQTKERKEQKKTYADSLMKAKKELEKIKKRGKV